MAVPLAPFALTALRIGAVAAAAYVVKRNMRVAPKHAWRERALDDTAPGIDLTTQHEAGEANTHAAARFSRTIRLGDGPGLEVDLALLGRIRFRRID